MSIKKSKPQAARPKNTTRFAAQIKRTRQAGPKRQFTNQTAMPPKRQNAVRRTRNGYSVPTGTQFFDFFFNGGFQRRIGVVYKQVSVQMVHFVLKRFGQQAPGAHFDPFAFFI